LKQLIKRIVILTVFLLALGLIFLPMIFDAPENRQPPLQSRIPPPPAVPVLPEPMPTRPVIIADTPAVIVPAGERAVAEPAEAWRELPILDEQGLPRGWSLQLGVFAEPEARQLLGELMAAGYRGYIREQQPTGVNGATGAPRGAVLVGPWLTRETALDYQTRLGGDLGEERGLTITIVPYELRSF